MRSRMWFEIALRYIKSKQREKVISVIAAFSLIGITLGVATLIIVTSVMNGFRKEFTEKVIGFNGHLTVYPNFDLDYKNMKKEISEIPGVTQVIPLVEKQGLLMTNDSVRGSLICGISQEDLQQKKMISENIKMGNLENFAEENAIAIGNVLAKKAGLFPRDNVTIIVPEMNKTGFGMIPRKKTFQLVATFNSGMYEYDNSVSYIPLELAQKLFKLGNKISCLSIFVDNPLQISQIKNVIEQKYAKLAHVTDWQSNNSSFMKAIEVERNVMFLILLLITLVASFNIISCMIMLVKDKERDIAILRTIGISKVAILKIFFIVGASIGIVGTFLGMIIGLIFSLNIQHIQAAIDKIFHTQVFSPEVYFLTHLPSLLLWEDVALTVSVSLFLSCLATFYPAWKASKLNPVEILRYV